MIGYFVRLLPIAVRARWQQQGQLVSRIDLRVQLGEIDINRHMNQAAYPRVMELGRTDWFIRSRAWRTWRGQGVNPMVAEQTITYRRELKPLARYTIDTRAVGIEGRFLILESHLLVRDRVHTRGVAKLLFVGPDGVLPAEAVEALARDVLDTPLEVEAWRVVAATPGL
jgi:acyl-CoA thioesterase FadM